MTPTRSIVLHPTWLDRLLLPLRRILIFVGMQLAEWHEEHGFRAAALPPPSISEDVCRARLSAALQVLAQVWPNRVVRIRAEMPRVFVAATGRDRRVLGAYVPGLRMCLLDPAYVAQDDTTPEILAAVIVHEATHARLLKRGHRHGWPTPERIERMCLRREEEFLRRATGSDVE